MNPFLRDSKKGRGVFSAKFRIKQVFYKGVDLCKWTREELNLSTPSTTSSPALIRLKQPILFVLRFFFLFFWTPEIIILIKVAFGKI